jgi:large subunit ribosomal protein L13
MKNTFLPFNKSNQSKKWYLIDAQNKTLGRLATQIAQILSGKHQSTYTNFLDTGDYVIVINADQINVTGKKAMNKLYRTHSGRPGGMKIKTFTEVKETQPERLIEKSVKGMLPHNILGRAMYRKLKVYATAEHPHVAQQPIQIF